ncbi:MAG: sulfatase-like hydrolase/transferase [Candidatus Aenigmarchaeota archaeon]|nr:sulfatase-like hydrolase/transferase [Candidatus Aenigmarchaeota archaeon]
MGIDAVTSYDCTTLACPPVRRYTVAAQTANDGQFEWNIGLAAGSYKIGIYDSANYLNIDYSDNAFSIVSAPVNTTSPKGNISISASPASGSAPLNVTFTAVVTNVSTPVQWDFGDYTGASEPCVVQFGGTTCTNIAPNRTISISHVYQSSGTYTAFAQSSPGGIIVMSNAVTMTVGQTSSASSVTKSPQLTATAQASALLIVCQNASWNITSGESWMNYKCNAECGGDWTACIYTSSKTDPIGRPLYMLAFAVDGAGGEFRWNLPYENEYNAALLTHSGGGGTSFMGDQQEPVNNMLNELQKAGLLVAGIKWQNGIVVSGAPTGWYSLSQANEKSTYYEKTKRVAEALGWVHDNLIPAGLRYGTVSCSGGSVATYSPVYWHGLDAIIDYQLVGGGPPAAWDGNAVCTGQASAGEPAGVCEDNPSKACASDAECTKGYKCAFPRKSGGIGATVLVAGVKDQIDYVHGLQNTCLSGKSDPAFDASSYRTTAGDTSYDHPVDFVVDIGGGSSDSLLSTDTELTVLYTAGRTYSNLATTDPAGKKWVIHTGDHCSWLGDTGFLNSTIQPMILRGLKLEVPASVTVLEPNGGEYWEAGKTYTVSWTSANAPNGSWVGRIALYEGASFLADLVPFLSQLPANGSVQWTVSNNSVLGNDFKVQVILYNGSAGNESELAQDFSDSGFSIVAPLAVQQYPLKLTKGWNMFSSPVFEYTPTPFLNFTNNCTYTSPVWRYSNERHRFEKATYVTDSREGYWIKVANNCTVALSGQLRTMEEFFTDFNLSKGWNIIGGIHEATPFASMTGCEFRRGPYWYDPVARRWEKATAMEPGKGYLVNVKESCQLRSGAAQMPGKPNIVVIMSDDQDAASMGVMNKVNSYLAQKGTTFSNNFVSYSICCPSRATFLTGQYAHNHRVLGNIPPQGGYYALDHNNTLPVWLQKAGYRTAHIGKYLNGYGTPSASTIANTDEYIPADYATLAKHTPSPAALEIPPGYTEWYGLVDPYTYAYYNYIINENGKLKKYGDQSRDYQTDVLTKKAVSFIEQAGKSQEPFFLVVAYVAPHAGLPPPPNEPEPAPRHKNALNNCTLPKTPSFNEEDISDKASVNQLPKLTQADIKGIESSYCNRLRSLLAVDDGVEQIVKALEKSGKLQNTYVFYTSDNGFMQGEHRISQGKGYPYEESARMPLIILGPSVPAGQTITPLVGNIDLAPTFAELAQARANRVMDGLSLMPLLRDPAASWRKDYLLEGLQIYLYSAVRNDKYLLAEFSALPGNPSGATEFEFYNVVSDSCHEADPYQLESQAQNACYASTIEALKERLNALKTCSGESCQ